MAEEPPWISRPMKRTQTVLPTEKAKVETANAMRPQRYGRFLDLERSANHPATAAVTNQKSVHKDSEIF